MPCPMVGHTSCARGDCNYLGLGTILGSLGAGACDPDIRHHILSHRHQKGGSVDAPR